MMLLLCMGAMYFLLLANMLQDPHNVELSGNRQSKLFDGEEDYGELVHVCVCVYMCFFFFFFFFFFFLR